MPDPKQTDAKSASKQDLADAKAALNALVPLAKDLESNVRFQLANLGHAGAKELQVSVKELFSKIQAFNGSPAIKALQQLYTRRKAAGKK